MSSTALPTAGRSGSSQVTEPAGHGQRSSALVASGIRGPVHIDVRLRQAPAAAALIVQPTNRPNAAAMGEGDWERWGRAAR